MKVRFTGGKGGAVRCEVLAGHKVSAGTKEEQLDDVDVNDRLYKKLRAKLPPKARAALDKDQDEWITWSDAPNRGRAGDVDHAAFRAAPRAAGVSVGGR